MSPRNFAKNYLELFLLSLVSRAMMEDHLIYTVPLDGRCATQQWKMLPFVEISTIVTRTRLRADMSQK